MGYSSHILANFHNILRIATRPGTAKCQNLFRECVPACLQSRNICSRRELCLLPQHEIRSDRPNMVVKAGLLRPRCYTRCFVSIIRDYQRSAEARYGHGICRPYMPINIQRRLSDGSCNRIQRGSIVRSRQPAKYLPVPGSCDRWVCVLQSNLWAFPNPQRGSYRAFSTLPSSEGSSKTRTASEISLLRSPGNRRGIRCLMDCMLKESSIVMPTFIALLASSALISIFPTVVGAYINNFSATNVPSMFQGACFIVGTAFASFMKCGLSGFANLRMSRRLREDLYTSLLRKDAGFHDKDSSGRLASVLAADVAISAGIVDHLCQLIRASTSFVAGIYFSLTLAPLSLIAHTMLPVVASLAVILPLSRLVQRHTSAQMRGLSALISHAEERLSNIKAVKVFSAEKFEHNVFMSKMRSLFITSFTVTLYHASMSCIAVGSVGSLILLMVNTSASLVTAGTMKIGDVTSLLMYSALVGGSLQSFTASIGSIQRCVGAADSLASYIDVGEAAVPSKSGIPNCAPSVELKNVVFAYPSRPDTEVLRDVSFMLPSGCTLVVLGESGCGKSSIIYLLLGLYQPQSGAILIDGRNIADVDLCSLRSVSGWVEQQGGLFNDTIRHNVLYGQDSDTVDLGDIYKQVGLLDTLNAMPDGDGTTVGQLGKSLSGGQRQRVSIARMLARDPKFVLLDEATAALDMESDRQMHHTLANFLRGRTAIVVTHRTSSLFMADYIMVMSSGKICQFGTKDDVLGSPCKQLAQFITSG